jgi:hypothetical protein
MSRRKGANRKDGGNSGEEDETCGFVITVIHPGRRLLNLDYAENSPSAGKTIGIRTKK